MLFPYGGGAWGATLYNCTLTDNFLDYGFGGGVYEGTLYNCMLTGNRAEWGGGTHSCVLNNCTLAGNSAVYEGGGTYNGTLENCIVYYNTADRRGFKQCGQHIELLLHFTRSRWRRQHRERASLWITQVGIFVFNSILLASMQE